VVNYVVDAAHFSNRRLPISPRMRAQQFNRAFRVRNRRCVEADVRANVIATPIVQESPSTLIRAQLAADRARGRSSAAVQLSYDSSPPSNKKVVRRIRDKLNATTTFAMSTQGKSRHDAVSSHTAGDAKACGLCIRAASSIWPGR